MGGVWERQICTVKSVMSAILHKNGSQLDDESLRTVLCEAEAIVNSRPLMVNTLSDPDFPDPLTPNHLLTLKTKVVLPPPGMFQSADLEKGIYGKLATEKQVEQPSKKTSLSEMLSW